MATDLKPEQLVDSISQLDLEDWMERAQAWAEASNITKQSNNVQMAVSYTHLTLPTTLVV